MKTDDKLTSLAGSLNFCVPPTWYLSSADRWMDLARAAARSTCSSGVEIEKMR